MSVLSTKTGYPIDRIKATVPIVITTYGKEGSVIEGTDIPEAIHVSTVAPKQVADPTGAGDAFRAGFLYGFARRWPLKASAQLGAVCATYAIETLGTQSHAFDLNEAAARYQAAFNETLPE